MTYNYGNAENVVTRASPYLDAMLSCKSEVVWQTADTKRLGYRIREAMSLAAKFNISPYHLLKTEFSIKEHSGRVIAEKRNATLTLSVADAKAELGVVIAPMVTSLDGIVGALLAQKSFSEIRFVDAKLDEMDLVRLYNVLSERNLFMIVGDGITVTRKDPEDAKWIP